MEGNGQKLYELCDYLLEGLRLQAPLGTLPPLPGTCTSAHANLQPLSHSATMKTALKSALCACTELLPNFRGSFAAGRSVPAWPSLCIPRVTKSTRHPRLPRLGTLRNSEVSER